MATAQKIACAVERVVSHGDRVYTVWLRPDRPAPMFRPGQFLHLALDPYDPTRFWPESRAFSIASSPLGRAVLRVSYSVRGRFTARMETELLEGRRVWIKMPYGHFVIDDQRDVVLVAGGTGITAFTAFLEALAGDRATPSRPADGGERSIVVAYGARTRGLLIYRDLVERCVREQGFVTASYFVEKDTTDEAVSWGTGMVPQTGRVSAAAMWPSVRRPAGTDYYISGPPGMLQTVSGDLRAAGISPEAIHIDAWE
jgi:ferredoxin-NADP reductase